MLEAGKMSGIKKNLSDFDKIVMLDDWARAFASLQGFSQYTVVSSVGE